MADAEANEQNEDDPKSTEGILPNETEIEGGHEGPLEPHLNGSSELTVSHPVKRVVLDIQEKDKADLRSRKAKAFADLVLYDSEGKPYIDVNRLVYKPRKRQKKELKERLSWFFNDVIFIIANFISLTCTSYMISLGLSIAAWDSNVKSIASYDHKAFKPEIAILEVLHTIGGRRAEASQIGYFLMGFAVVSAVNVFVGIFACIYGFKLFLIQHIVFDVISILVQLYIGLLCSLGGTCLANELEIFKRGFEDFIHLQASTNVSYQIIVDDQYYASLQLDSIQINMECCGASNWTDYLNPDIVKFSYYETRHSSSEVAKVLPYSCCKNQWVRNLQCSEGVHEWAAPVRSKLIRRMFRERIHQEGCGQKIWLMCIRLLTMAGPMLLCNAFFNTILVLIESITVVLQIKSYTTISRELASLEELTKKSDEKAHRKLSRGKDALLQTEEEEDEEKTALELLRDQLAPPTEDEIEFIKSNTAYQQFEKKLQRTALGKMINKVRSTVTGKSEIKAPRDHKAHRESLLKKKKHHHKDYLEKLEKIKTQISGPNKANHPPPSAASVTPSTSQTENPVDKKPTSSPKVKKPAKVKSKKSAEVPKPKPPPVPPPPVVKSPLKRTTTIPGHVILSKTKRKVRVRKDKKGNHRDTPPESQASTDVEEIIEMMTEEVQTDAPQNKPKPKVVLQDPPMGYKKKSSSPLPLLIPRLQTPIKKGFDKGSEYDRRTGLIKKEKVEVAEVENIPSTKNKKKSTRKVVAPTYTSRKEDTKESGLEDLIKSTSKKNSKKTRSKQTRKKSNKPGKPRGVIRTAWV